LREFSREVEATVLHNGGWDSPLAHNITGGTVEPRLVIRNLAALRLAAASHGVFVLIVASMTLNLVQAHQLRTRIRTPSANPHIGLRVPAIDVKTADAKPIRFDYSTPQQPTILYYFNPSCSWCERNWQAVEALERGTRGRYRFVAVTTADRDRVNDHAFPVATFWAWHEAGRRAYQLGGTPHTLVIGSDGRVVRSWVGAYIRNTRSDLERYFQVRLPEVALRVPLR
jgi:hypothetical protein